MLFPVAQRRKPLKMPDLIEDVLQSVSFCSTPVKRQDETLSVARARNIVSRWRSDADARFEKMPHRRVTYQCGFWRQILTGTDG